MRPHLKAALIAALLAVSCQTEEIEMLLGGSPDSPTELKKVNFFPDFRESRMLIMDHIYACNMLDDCERDKTILYKNVYCDVPFQYYFAKVNVNFKQQRMLVNVPFYHVVKSEENFDTNILGLSRNSEYLIHYFKNADRKSQLLRLSFRGEEGGRMSVANPYVLSQAKSLSFYTNHRNFDSFYLDVTMKVARASDPDNFMIKEKLRLCPFSNPARTNWQSVFFSGTKAKIDAYRTIFKDVVVHPDEYAVALVHNESRFVMKFNQALKSIDEKAMFKLGFADDDNCDLYFGFAFVRFFKMDFLMGYDEKANKVTLSFQTLSEAPKPFGYWILGLGLLIVIIFSIYVFKTHYQLTVQKKEKERSDLEESLRDV